MPSETTKGALAAEADLVTRARRHDEDAVRAIIGQNNRRLFRLARSIVKDDNEAEDIVQECYPNFLNWREKVSNINGCIAEVSTTGGGVGREPSLLAR